MTSNGTEYTTKYKVGSIICDSALTALLQLERERNSTSAVNGIEVIQERTI